MGFNEGLEQFKKAIADKEAIRLAEEASKAQSKAVFLEYANMLGDQLVLGMLENFVRQADLEGYVAESKFEAKDSPVTWSVRFVPYMNKQSIDSLTRDADVCIAKFELFDKGMENKYLLKTSWSLFGSDSSKVSKFLDNISDIKRELISDNLTAFTKEALTLAANK